MSRAYELFYANHLLESKMESCALCFQAAEMSRKSKKKASNCFVLLPFRSFLSACVWSAGWKGAAVRTKQLKKQSQIFGIQNDVNPPLCFVPKMSRTEGERGWVWEQTANPELSVMIRACFFFFLLLCTWTHRGLVSLSSTFVLASPRRIFTLFFLPDDRPVLVFTSSEAWQAGGRRQRGREEKRGEKSWRFTTAWICHFEDEVYEYI